MPTTEARRDRGQLHREVMEVCNAYVADPNGYLESPHLYLTTHRIAQKIEQNSGKRVTNSAVQRVLKRWEEIGFAILAQKPVAFLDYTDDAVELGLTALENEFREEVRRARLVITTRNRLAAQHLAVPDEPPAPPSRTIAAGPSSGTFPVDEPTGTTWTWEGRNTFEPSDDEGLTIDLDALRLTGKLVEIPRGVSPRRPLRDPIDQHEYREQHGPSDDRWHDGDTDAVPFPTQPMPDPYDDDGAADLDDDDRALLEALRGEGPLPPRDEIRRIDI